MMKNPEIKELWTQLRVKFPQHFNDTAGTFIYKKLKLGSTLKVNLQQKQKTKLRRRIGKWIDTQKQITRTTKCLKTIAQSGLRSLPKMLKS